MRSLHILIIVCLAFTLLGCSRTVDDVEKWKTKNDIEKLQKALKDPKAEVRKAAVLALGDLKSRASVDHMIACLNDEDEEVMLAALDALVSIGDLSISTPLIAMLKNESETARLKATETLGMLKISVAVSGLTETLNDEVPEIQLAAIHSLGQLGEVSGSAALISKLLSTESSVEIRQACISALAQTGGSDAANLLLKIENSGTPPLNESAKEALTKMGNAAIQYALNALSNTDDAVRAGALSLLRERDVVPTEGSERIWYILAIADQSGQDCSETAAALVEQDSSTVATLVDAAAHPSAIIRESACLALERIGEASFDLIKKRAQSTAVKEAKDWFNLRKEWEGAPSQYLDFWGMLSALNPNFPSLEDMTDELKKSDPQPVRAHIPILISELANKNSASRAKKLLQEAGETARLPLIAAISSENQGVAEAAAELLSDYADPRTCNALMNALMLRQQKGEDISSSSLYSALVQLNTEKAEPFLLKIRPSTGRAAQLLRRRLPGIEIVAVSMIKTESAPGAPVHFSVGHKVDGEMETLEIVFEKNEQGEWHERLTIDSDEDELEDQPQNSSSTPKTPITEK
ncbi:MAG: HEAT repeat domain-containing protein [Lentisphaerae bacterium]|nr:HEAT repeat domain-containing protein [Lentisphaerota bacterium]